MIFFICSSKPTSNIRSASSITNPFRLRKTKPFVPYMTEVYIPQCLEEYGICVPRGDQSDGRVSQSID